MTKTEPCFTETVNDASKTVIINNDPLPDNSGKQEPPADDEAGKKQKGGK